ncbi:autotransporter assembly complex protein TamA [Piscinibacter koreensis]|uniref:BamA/TamA family outer membrane protein n=1 Tax=Piscinibacter koreensis TaxID=2742824 RepID=A0A7Y6NMK7_9BURK|nr:BamA/TamA family outer membrane protein [Schlegelella koreensis]NUZ05919.1 BamA/TamA family outer membrane protein [Schlegelella koreensis]
MRGPLGAAALLLATGLLGGCASLPFFGKDDDAKSAAEASEEPQVVLYELDVEAPGALKTLLTEYLDLARFQKAPQSDAISGPELERLVAAAPAQAKSLLETEGYFDAIVSATQSADADGKARVTVKVEPGRRTTIKSVTIQSATPIAPRTPTREDRSKDRIERMRRNWTLDPGQPFRQAAWSSAKTAALGELRGDGYPLATWRETMARIDAEAASATLDLTVDGGPLFHFGAVRVEGTERYDPAVVRRLAPFALGDVYSEKAVLDYQERLVKVGLFQGAAVTVDVENGPPEGAPVTVRVRELPQHQATFGVGYSANTGARFSVDHYDRKVFGWPWIAHSTLVLGSELRSIGTDFTSYPRNDLSSTLVGINLEQLKNDDETRNSAALRVGRTKDTGRYERVYFAELSHSRVGSDEVATTSDAAAVHYQWLRRDVDSVLLPTRGSVISLQGALGYGIGSETRASRPGKEDARGPFLRTYGRINAYKPFGSWYLNGRLEAGQVFVNNRIAVPDTLLFRAGGDNSVRGYGYRDLGHEIDGTVVGGRVLLTGSVEAEHPILASLPQLLGAVFIDAGNAADRWGDWSPVFGTGVGVHFRSPVGVLRLDLAYGEAVRRARLHLSVGVAF